MADQPTAEEFADALDAGGRSRSSTPGQRTGLELGPNNCAA